MPRQGAEAPLVAPSLARGTARAHSVGELRCVPHVPLRWRRYDASPRMTARRGGALVRRGLGVVAACALLIGSAALSMPARAQVIDVQPGDSIQAAVDGAQPGDTIAVAAGTYAESVVIKKDHITLQGSGSSASGTVLEPPTTPAATDCSDRFGEVGICFLADGTPGSLDRVVGGGVTGFFVRDFDDAGILAYGTNKIEITSTRTKGSGDYGMIFMRSRNGSLRNNRVRGAHVAGISYGSSSVSTRALIASNTVSKSRIGIQIGTSKFGTLTGNTLKRNCAGIMLRANGGADRVKLWTIDHNKVRRNSRACVAGGGIPALSGLGIYLVGTRQATVIANQVRHNVRSGRTVASGGIVGAKSKGMNRIVSNRVLKNRRFDIRWGPFGSVDPDELTGNVCQRSKPTTICA